MIKGTEIQYNLIDDEADLDGGNAGFEDSLTDSDAEIEPTTDEIDDSEGVAPSGVLQKLAAGAAQAMRDPIGLVLAWHLVQSCSCCLDCFPHCLWLVLVLV